jgi:hypothetical protein
MPSGTYIGPEDQFRGRRANLVIHTGYVMAQFDTGKLWETHGRLCFLKSDWKIDGREIEDQPETD